MAPGRNPMRHYSCLTIPQLCTLPLKRVIAENAVTFSVYAKFAVGQRCASPVN
jgi:hypothetical protein